MRQLPSTTPATSPLVTLIDALPDSALRPLILSLLNGANSPAAELDEAPAAPPKRRVGWPRGRPRGPRKVTKAKAVQGDGIGKPLGILNPAGGIPICDTASGTPAGQFTWQDLVSLKFAVPLQYHKAGVYLVNQSTFGLMLTMSDAIGRPLMVAMPTEPSIWYINGSPVRIVSQMPDCAPGATPVLFGDLQQTYMIVQRKSTTMLHDPYSSGFCHLFKFEARVGGGVLCPNASRLLRIK